MIAVEMARRMVDGLFAPSRSAREALEARYDLNAVVLFIILAFAMEGIIGIVIRLVYLGDASGISLGNYVFGLLGSFASVAVIGLSIWIGGAVFGGKGTREQAINIAAWHGLIIVPLKPFFVMVGLAMAEVAPDLGQPIEPEAMANINQTALLLGLYAYFQYLWTLACFTKELHGFSNPWGVLGVMVAVSALFGQFLIALST